MSAGRRLFVVWSLFAGAALLGPALQWAAFATGVVTTAPSSTAAKVLGDIVFMLWPAQPLAVIEVNVGSQVALVVAVSVNVLLFSATGLLAGVVARRTGYLAALFVVVLLATLLFALWGAGFDWRYIGTCGLGCAVVLQVLLFLLTARLGRAERVKGSWVKGSW